MNLEVKRNPIARASTIVRPWIACVIAVVILGGLSGPSPAQEPVCRETGFSVDRVETTRLRFGLAGIASGDFNGDGIEDIAVSNRTSGVFSVGWGSTTEELRLVHAAVGTDTLPPSGGVLVTGDFNNDGIDDVVVSTSPDCYTALSTGFKTFRVPGSFRCYSPDYLFADDFNGDGRLDLLSMHNEQYSLQVVLGDGQGGFSPVPDFSSSPTGYYFAADTGDFNNDGWADVVIAATLADIYNYPDAVYSSLSVLLSDGTGHFLPLDGGRGVRIGSRPVAVAAADLNHDGRLDAVVTTESGIQTYLGDNTGHFDRNPAMKTELPIAPQELFVRDFNADGHLDAAVGPRVHYIRFQPFSGDYAIFLGDGMGGLQLDHAANLNAPSEVTGGGLMIAGEFTGDGRVDLARVEHVGYAQGTNTIHVTRYRNSCPVRVSKEALEESAALGESLRYRIGVKNISSSTVLTEVTVGDEAPEEGEIIAMRTDTGVDCAGALCNLGGLSPGQQREAEVELRLGADPALVEKGVGLRNVAAVSWSGGEARGNARNRIRHGVDLTLHATTSSDPAVRGEDVVIRAEVTNKGIKTAQGVYVGDEYPEGIILVVPPRCTVRDVGSPQVTCPLGDIAPQQSAAVEWTIRVPVRSGIWAVASSLTTWETIDRSETYPVDNNFALSLPVVLPGTQPVNTSFTSNELTGWTADPGLIFEVSQGRVLVLASGALRQRVDGLSPGQVYSLRAQAGGSPKVLPQVSLRALDLAGNELGTDGPRWGAPVATRQLLFSAPADGTAVIELRSEVTGMAGESGSPAGVYWDNIELWPVAPSTIRVPEDYAAIQEAIEASSDGDRISVGPGIYRELLDFDGRAIVVESREGPGNTVIDAGDNGPAVSLDSAEPSSAALRGMRVRNGTSGVVLAGSALVENCWITDNGTGVDVQSGDPLIRGNRIEFNGGAMRGSDSALIENNRFANNDGLVSLSGGGVVFSNNEVTNQTGGGVTISNQAVVNNNLIHENLGWGIRVSASSGFFPYNVVIEQNLIFSSRAPSGSTGQQRAAGGILLDLSAPLQTKHINNNTVVLRGQSAGPGVQVTSTDPETIFFNNIIVSDGSAAVVCPAELQWQAVNNLAYRPGGESSEGCGDLFHSPTNWTADPKFVDPAGGDFHLRPGSIAIDNGQNASLPETDLDGKPRVVDGNGDGDARVDLGAFEVQAPARAAPPAPRRRKPVP